MPCIAMQKTRAKYTCLKDEEEEKNSTTATRDGAAKREWGGEGGRGNSREKKKISTISTFFVLFFSEIIKINKMMQQIFKKSKFPFVLLLSFLDQHLHNKQLKHQHRLQISIPIYLGLFCVCLFVC
jgi:hypothetical protein